ncbi:RNA polymerase II-associated factor 1 homolog [Myripristis murdjan]|uniref:RNA polymerase II-associated factor 1 homolog n=1 Tax=Myripristis murdjan TaxID=586833 RepID=UPI0011763CDD|nr:RNA polymerase II-associated factor 1 homolog [Myripristis murdjan]
MEYQQQHRKQLETIQEEEEEETEQRDETEGSRHGEGDEDGLQTEVDEETEKIAQGNGESEENGEELDTPLRVMRARRRSSFDKSSSSQMPSALTDQEEMQANFSVSDPSYSAEDLSDEASMLGHSLTREMRLERGGRGRRRHLGIKLFQARGGKRKQPRQSAQKKRGRTRKRKMPPAEEPFPEWLVDLMFNIEEATTHELVIE